MILSFLTTSTTRTKGEGLYTKGVENYLFVPLSSISNKAPEIISNVRKRIEAEIAAGTYPPALAEQYRIQLNNLEKNVPSCEIVPFPAFLGDACMFCLGIILTVAYEDCRPKRPWEEILLICLHLERPFFQRHNRMLSINV